MATSNNVGSENSPLVPPVSNLDEVSIRLGTSRSVQRRVAEDPYSCDRFSEFGQHTVRGCLIFCHRGARGGVDRRSDNAASADVEIDPAKRHRDDDLWPKLRFALAQTQHTLADETSVKT